MLHLHRKTWKLLSLSCLYIQSLCLHSGTSCVAWVSWWEEAVHADHRKHGHRPQQGAKLHHSAAPHEGTVALVAQDHADDHLHIGQSENKEDPGQHLWSRWRWVFTSSGLLVLRCFWFLSIQKWRKQSLAVYSQWWHHLRTHSPAAGMDSALPCPLYRFQSQCPLVWGSPLAAETCEVTHCFFNQCFAGMFAHWDQNRSSTNWRIMSQTLSVCFSRKLQKENVCLILWIMDLLLFEMDTGVTFLVAQTSNLKNWSRQLTDKMKAE